MTGPLVELTVRESIAIVRLDRADRLNALSDEVLRDFEDALDRVEAPACRAIVVTGTGRAFCAGADLGSCSTGWTRARSRSWRSCGGPGSCSAGSKPHRCR